MNNKHISLNNNMLIKGRTRALSLDIARAICIVLVVVGHYSPEYSPAWWISMQSFLRTFRTPLFMFVSGYVYMRFRKKTTYWMFLKKKVHRLIIPYFVVSTIIITIKLTTQGSAYVDNPVTAWSYLKMFYHPEAGYFLWFMWALWWIFVIVPLFKTRKSLWLLFAISIVVHFWFIIPTKLFALKEASRMLVYFMGGVVVADEFMRKPKLKQWFYGWKMSIAPILFIALYAANKCGYHVNGLIIATTGIWMVLYVSRSYVIASGNHKGFLYDIAAASYIIYLFHTTFEGFAKSAIRHIPTMIDGDNTLMFVIGAIIVIGCGVAIPLLLYKYVFKRYKITKVAFGL